MPLAGNWLLRMQSKPFLNGKAFIDAKKQNNGQVLILSHSVTPLKDSVPALRQYAAERHIDSKNWLLLTGDKDATYRLARQAYFADEAGGYGKKPDEFLHTENVVLIDTKGRIRGVYNSSLTVEIDRLRI